MTIKQIIINLIFHLYQIMNKSAKHVMIDLINLEVKDLSQSRDLLQCPLLIAALDEGMHF